MLEFLFLLVLVCLGTLVALFGRMRHLRARLDEQDDHRQRLERRVAVLEGAAAVEAGVGGLAAQDAVGIAPMSVPLAPPPLLEVAGAAVGATGAEAEGWDGWDGSGRSGQAATPEAPPRAEVAAATAPKPDRPAWAAVDWERFMGVRLFAWLGGLALFLAVAYFVKYSFERNLIPPAVRVAMGLAMGLALLVGGVKLRRREYEVTSQTFCATGVVVLYASLFAGHSFYHLAWFTPGSTFAFMTMVTAVAFVLAVRMPALVVAVLGMLGGFLTPILLSTGQDQPLALFSYLALIDAGLIAVALRRRWHFLAVLGAVSTAVMELGWAGRFFAADRVGLAFAVFAGFTALFVAGLAVARWRDEVSEWLSSAVAVSAFTTLVFGGGLLATPELAAQPGKVFVFVLAADVALLTVAWWRERLAGLHVAAGGFAFLFVLIWMANSVTPELLGWGLGLSLVFAVLHAGFPLVLQRFRPGMKQVPLAQVFPPLALVSLLLPLLKLESPSFAIWPVVVLVNLLALGLAAVSSGLVGALVALLLSGLASAIWIGRLPSEVGEVGGALLIVVGMAALFVGAGTALIRVRAVVGGTGAGQGPDWLRGAGEDALRLQLPVVATMLPFLLLAQLVAQVRLPEPSLVFGAMLVILMMLFGLTVGLRFGALPLAGLVGLALVEWVWVLKDLGAATRPGLVMVWVVGFQSIFALFPIVFLSGRFLGGWGEDRDREAGSLPWVAAAMAGLPQFLLGYQVIDRTWPNGVMGLVPLAFGLPAAGTFWWILRNVAGTHPERLVRLAWFGGTTLFFLTVAIPVQFDHQWVTLGLALEGAALLWLFQRVPHPGLRLVGVGLLGTVFARLAMNPFVLEYAVRGATPLANWWLYTYSLAAAALYLGAWWLKPGSQMMMGSNARALLVTGATILVFALVNIEVADFFTPVGERVSFEFSGNFGRDMSYTIAWALFALVLVAVGLGRRLVASRWSGLALLALAAVKLFLHDLARLDQLYRIGALAGVAAVAIAASVLYQRFVAREEKVTAHR